MKQTTTFPSLALVVISLTVSMTGCSKFNAEDTREQEQQAELHAYMDQLVEAAGQPNEEQARALVRTQQQLDWKALDTLELKALQRVETVLAENWIPVPEARQRFAAIPQEPMVGRGYCGARDSVGYAALREPRFALRALREGPQPVIHIPVAFHIIVNNSGTGALTPAMVIEQLAVLNRAYSPLLTFSLFSMETTRNQAWFEQAAFNIRPDLADAMTSALARDPAKIMNVYTIRCDDDNLLGEAPFPWFEDVISTSRDAVIVHYATFPGGSKPGYDQGKTLVHETGHYLGLYHTFHDSLNQFLPCDVEPYNGCGKGDLVEDTPPQKFCHQYGCGTCNGDEACGDCSGRCDTCPDKDNGADPTSNYMGYNPDPCMTEFKSGQRVRMMRAIRQFRSAFIVPPT